LIEAFELKLRNTIDATNATNDLQKVDAICDTEDLLQKDNTICDINEIIQKVDATCGTKYLLQMVDYTCDTHDLMVDTKETQEMDDESLTNHKMESYNGLMQQVLASISNLS
jgi:hypothetical protein